MTALPVSSASYHGFQIIEAWCETPPFLSAAWLSGDPVPFQKYLTAHVNAQGNAAIIWHVECRYAPRCGLSCPYRVENAR